MSGSVDHSRKPARSLKARAVASHLVGPGKDVARKGNATAKAARKRQAALAIEAMQAGFEGIHSFLLLVEVTNFSLLRRHLGVPRADRLAQDVADRASQALPEADCRVVSRNLIEIHYMSSRPDAARTAIARLRAAFALPVVLDGEAHNVCLAIGGATASSPEYDPVRLSELAEAALAQSKGNESDVVRDLAVDGHDMDPLALMRDLSVAMTEGQLFLQYQPKVHVRQQKIASAEALIRWRHPERGLVLPGDFITLAEQTGQIAGLTLWTLRQVIKDQQLLSEDGLAVPIFINISGVLLSDPTFARQACSIVRGCNGMIGFEITETAVIRDPQTAIAHLKLFSDVGVPIAIDDYGAGLSSLAYLKQLPASELKIDKLFVTQLTSSNRDPLIVRSTIDLAHALDMEVTAEGVETPAAMALLSVMGCDLIQGYLISRPIEIGAFREFMAQQRHLDTVASPRGSFNRAEAFWKSA